MSVLSDKLILHMAFIVTHTFYHHFPTVLLRNGKMTAKS